MTTIADPITPPRVITQEFRTPAAAIPSFCIGVLPSAATIGLAAPVPVAGVPRPQRRSTLSGGTSAEVGCA